MKNLNIWKNVFYLFLRYFMICVFMFMCVVIISVKSNILGPILGVFYFVALLYYFWFTMKTEGEKDAGRVEHGQMSDFKWKGGLCCLILVVFLIIVNILPNFFPDPTPPEYKAYFTGEVTELTYDSNFNRDLRAASNKEGYVSQIEFATTGEIHRLVYVTKAGWSVRCDSTVTDENQMYAASADRLTLKEKNENVVYYTEAIEDTSDEGKAFIECKNAIDDIVDVMKVKTSYSAFAKVASFLKAVFVMALSYFVRIFRPLNGFLPDVWWDSLVYAVCMAVTVCAGQLGYWMGRKHINLLPAKKSEGYYDIQ